MTDLSIALSVTQSKVIGFFKPYRSSIVEMVLENDNGMLKTICIGSLLGLHTMCINKNQGILVMFEDGETLFSLLNTPFKLNEYHNQLK